MQHRSMLTPGHFGKHRNLYTAVTAALAGTLTGVSAQAQTEAESAAGDNRLEEVIVSARKRDENVQDIPQSIQAFSQQDITKVGIKGLGDVAKFVPAMTVIGSTAGLNKIVFRGLADSVRPYIADSSAAIYLDEQPLTTGAQSPEIRPIDMERIESLAGPQGTLYGASSQSGTVRYIVAKPDVTAFAANAGGGLHTIDGGGNGWDADAMVNIPLIQDKFAIRLVGFGAKDAGYIDNVFGYTPGRLDADTGERIIGSKTNADIVENDFNSADWVGGRISAKWFFTDDWALTGIYNYQNAEINGFNDYDPTTGDLKTIKFNRESWDDEWSNFQLTLDGSFGEVGFTSSTAYFERDTAYVFDGTSGIAYYHSALGVYGRGTCGSNPYYANYNNYDFATACELNGTGYDFDDADPSGTWNNIQRDSRWTHETRLSGSTSRWDWTMGFFYQEAKQRWDYFTIIDDYQLTESWAAQKALYGDDLEPTDVHYGSGEQSKRTDMAVFGESTVNLTDHWKLLVGLRWYDTEIDRTSYSAIPLTGPRPISISGGSEDGFLPKLGVQYFFQEDKMLYALYSEGFRSGGTNRARGNPTLPVQFNPDTLKNYEFGLKSQWMDGQIQFNVIGYFQTWEDMQLELTDPSFQFGEPFQTVIANVGDANVNGFDTELTWLANEHLSFGLVSTYLFKAEIADDILVFDERAPEFIALNIPGGTRLPLVADLNLSTYAEYDWDMNIMGGGEAYVRLQYAYTGSSYNALRDNDGDPDGDGYGGRVQTPGYDIWDLRAGFSNADWEFTAFVDNFTDERAVTFRSMGADVYWGRQKLRILKPRTYGFSIRKYFN
ncbi:MAG: TonB-dependent receptor [Xanthomonadales bacterium]|nr:TonB-dependent receptor [Xanthomonadales bacterium]